MMNFASKIFLLLGLIFIGLSTLLFYQRISPTRLAFAGQITSTAVINPKESPTNIYIPAISISLPIVGQEIIDGHWSASDTSVNYLITSSLPGAMGNSIFYAHNFKSLFGRLSELKEKDSIFISFPSKKTYEFKVSKISVVDPSDIGILANSKDKRITLYTCKGFLDSKRLVVSATLKE